MLITDAPTFNLIQWFVSRACKMIIPNNWWRVFCGPLKWWLWPFHFCHMLGVQIFSNSPGYSPTSWILGFAILLSWTKATLFYNNYCMDPISVQLQELHRYERRHLCETVTSISVQACLLSRSSFIAMHANGLRRGKWEKRQGLPKRNLNDHSSQWTNLSTLHKSAVQIRVLKRLVSLNSYLYGKSYNLMIFKWFMLKSRFCYLFYLEMQRLWSFITIHRKSLSHDSFWRSSILA